MCIASKITLQTAHCGNIRCGFVHRTRNPLLGLFLCCTKLSERMNPKQEELCFRKIMNSKSYITAKILLVSEVSNIANKYITLIGSSLVLRKLCK